MQNTIISFDNLADELVLKIFSHLDLHHLLAISEVNKRFNRIGNGNFLFFNLIREENPSEKYNPIKNYKNEMMFKVLKNIQDQLHQTNLAVEKSKQFSEMTDELIEIEKNKHEALQQYIAQYSAFSGLEERMHRMTPAEQEQKVASLRELEQSIADTFVSYDAATKAVFIKFGTTESQYNDYVQNIKNEAKQFQASQTPRLTR